MTLYVRQQKRHWCIHQSFGLCGRGWGWDGWESGIEICILSYMKWIASPGSMHETGCSGLMHWDDPEGWYGEGDRRGVQDGEHMYVRGGFMSMYGKTTTILKKKRKKMYWGWQWALCLCVLFIDVYHNEKWKLKNFDVKWKSLSHVQLFATQWTYSSWNSTGQITGVGSLSLLQGIFPTQGSNPGIPHCWQILYQLSHKGIIPFKNNNNGYCMFIVF